MARQFVRAAGAFTFNDGNRDAGDQSLHVEPGDRVPADHWAVATGSIRGAFVPVDLNTTDLESAVALWATRDELAAIAGRHAGARHWPDGIRERVDNLERREARLLGELRSITARRDRLEEYVRNAGPDAFEPHVDPSTLPSATSTRTLDDRGGRDRSAAMRTVDTAVRAGHLPEHAGGIVERLVTDGPDRDRDIAARWAIATGAPDYLRAFGKLLADPTRGHLLWTAAEADAFRAVATVQAELRAMSLTDTAGGFMVPLTLDPTILLTSAGSINPLRRIARVEQIVTSDWNGISSAGASAEWKAEAAEAAEATLTIAQPSIPVHFGDSFVPYSFEVGMDAVNFLPELQRVLVDAADNLMATAYTTGSGVGQPTGVVTALVGGASIVTGTEAFPSSQVYTVQNALPARFSERAQWCAHIAIINKIAQFESAAGARLFPEVGEGRLLRKPLNELSNLDGVIDAGVENYILLYGDFTEFVIVDRIGTTLEILPNLVGANRRPTGQRGALLWFRTGSDSVVDNAFRLLNAT
jgi:HK97 family phage major capsid protein